MKISLCIPYHQSPDTAFYLSRLLASIEKQTFKDYEIIITNEGLFARNHNAAIQRAKGEIIQFLQRDDYFADENSLQRIVGAYYPSTTWAITACLHESEGQVGWPHTPKWTPDIYTGNNRLGSVSTLSFRNVQPLLFEEPLTWLVDCDLYYRLYLKYGEPKIIPTYNVVINAGTDRLSHTLTEELKAKEVEYLHKKYAK